MSSHDVIELTRKLVSFDTINPPGDEKKLATFIGQLLSKEGFTITYNELSSNRLSVIAEKGMNQNGFPIIFSGHLDTVPLGTKRWDFNPFLGEIKNGKIYGRGTSDMKGGVAAMICAAIEAFEKSNIEGGIRLIFTAGEETGCHGAMRLPETRNKSGKARGIIIGEPTGNIPAIGHKGGLYLNISYKGRTAHSSMPHLGENAIYKAAHAIVKLEHFDFQAEEDELLGLPTINIGTIKGGINLNSVPDFATFSIDIRSTTKNKHVDQLKKLKELLGNKAELEILTDLPAICTEKSLSFVQNVYKACGIIEKEFTHSLPYVTDGSVLQEAYPEVPIIILGPGEAEMAHQVNEYCLVNKLKKSVNIYKSIILER